MVPLTSRHLPKDRLWQEDDGWEVGLSGVSFPTIPLSPPPQKVHPENILVHEDYEGLGHPDEWNNNGYLCTYYYTIVNSVKISQNLWGVVILSEITPSSTGIEFLKKVIDKMEQKITESLKAGDTLYINVMENSKTMKIKMGVTLRWEGDDLVLDNTHVFISGVQWKYFGFVFELAQHMGWLTTNPGLDRFTPGHYHRGLNMLLVLIDEEAPKADYTQESFRDGSIFQEYPNTFAHICDRHRRSDMVCSVPGIVTEGQGWSVAYQGAHFMVLAKAFNWRFIRINEAFEKFKKTPLTAQTIERPLFVYVNLVESQWLEDSYDGLFRTVPYKSREAWWEPRQVQYHRLSGSTIETGHVRLTEVNGRPITFPTDQRTTICLHFRCRRHGSCRFTQASSSFKVCLPHPVKFDGDWEVGLTSVSMPDQGLDLKESLDPDKDSL